MGSVGRFLVAASVALSTVGCADSAQRDPCDAANRTTDDLRAAAAAFHLSLPTDASDVSFTTSEGGMAFALTLVFRTTPDGLARFVTGSNFTMSSPASAPKPAGRQLAAGSPQCRLDQGFTYSAFVSGDSTYPGQIRSFAVDNTTVGAPRVLVVAAVL